MNVAIIYSSKHGTTEKICNAIASHIAEKAEVTLINVDDMNNVDLSHYDSIVLGTSIYAGKPRKKMVEFCSINEEYILTRRLFLFVCGMDRKKAIEEIEATYSPALLNHADATNFIDGEFRLARMTFFERLLLRAFFGIKHSETREYGPIISDFAENIIAK